LDRYGGQRIFADNDTITGSIGVFGLLLNIQKIANNNGIDWDTVKTGKLADISTITRPKNPQELEIYQAAVNRFYDLFIETVARGENYPQTRLELCPRLRLDGKRCG
jgi:protease-4